MVGEAAKNAEDTISGVVFVILGIILYALLARFSRSVKGK